MYKPPVLVRPTGDGHFSGCCRKADTCLSDKNNILYRFEKICLMTCKYQKI